MAGVKRFPLYSNHQLYYVYGLHHIKLIFCTRKVSWDGYRKGRLWIAMTSQTIHLRSGTQPWNISVLKSWSLGPWCSKPTAVRHQDWILTPLLYSPLSPVFHSLEVYFTCHLTRVKALHSSCLLLFFQYALEVSSKPFWSSAAAPALESAARLIRADIIPRKWMHVKAAIKNAIPPTRELLRQQRPHFSTFQIQT